MNVRTQSPQEWVAEQLSLLVPQSTKFFLSHQGLDDVPKVGSVIRPEAVVNFDQGWANMPARCIHERSKGKTRAHTETEASFLAKHSHADEAATDPNVVVDCGMVWLLCAQISFKERIVLWLDTT